MAIIAGFERVRGERVVTLDADLQNPPEEIAQAAGARWTPATTTSAACGAAREDSLVAARRPRALMNRLRERITRIRMTDQGCMLRAYSRDIVDAVAASREVSTYHPGARLHVRAQPDRGRGRRTRSAPPASRSIRCTS